MGGATMGRFGKNPYQEKEVVSSMIGTQISIAVKCKAAKMVVKSNSHRGQAVSCWKKEDMIRPRCTNKQVELRGGQVVQTYGMEDHRRRWRG